ncbi:zinc-binding alcohol dehydrogenase family protein [Mammaliicoccus sp. Dog046]|uniref:zinc-binding alcohol dehydrogenase family protein n=1 Tax=Mammaliicoccus sp. Dog046 TaxID=3034233 RepID=UPI002B25DE45|nr:zinc-binding alcohol dehydrogenase family protein [Mammaliicoccus sp. Dog046]WQK86031.1 zinc-binding alcohol dehydrogenase family protein [Mammaliicoccus sp. Dog046]
MKAIGFTTSFDLNETNAFEERDLPIPTASGRDLLVKVKAASINPVDTKSRNTSDGEFKILGYDGVGVVEAVGEDVELFHVGDEVYYSGTNTRQGSNAEYQLVDERIVGLKPEFLSYAEAAALPLTALTSLEALFEGLNISTNPEENTGKTLLIINGAGGVGSIATQMAKELGLTVITTASRKETRRWSEKMGADIVLNHKHNLPDELKAHKIDGVDYIFNTHSSDAYFNVMADIIKPRGRIVALVNFKDKVDLNALKDKSVTFSFEFMFTRPKYETEDMIEHHNYLRKLTLLLDRGRLKTTLYKKLNGLSVETITEAHQLIEQGNSIGKIVIEY